MSIQVLETETNCSLKDKNGKCCIMLPQATFCLDCHCIHIGTHCPNCCSQNCVRLVELMLSEGDISEQELKRIIDHKVREHH
jgi:hypothetical protein